MHYPQKYSSKQLSALGLIFLISLSSNIIAPMIGPLFFSKNGFFPNFSYQDKMHAYLAITAVYALGMIFSNFIWGFLADKYGANRMLIVTMYGALLAYAFCVSSLVFALFSLFLLGRGLEGFVAGRRAIALSQVAMYSDDAVDGLRRAEMSNTVGLFLGPIFSGGIVTLLASNNLATYSAAYIVLSIITLFMLVTLHRDNEPTAPVSHNRLKLRALVAHWSTYLGFFLFQIFWYLYFVSVTPFVIIQWQLTPMQVALFFSGIVFFYVCSLLKYLPVLQKRLSNEQIIKLSSIILVLLSLLLGLTGIHFYVFVLFNIIFVSHVALIMPIYASELSLVLPPEHQGKAFGIQNTLIGLAWLLSALLLSPLSKVGVSAAFQFGAFILVLVIAVRLKFKNHKSSDVPE